MAALRHEFLKQSINSVNVQIKDMENGDEKPVP